MTEETVIDLVHKYLTTPESDTGGKQTLLKTTVAAIGEFLYTHLGDFRLDYVTEDIRSDFILALYPRFENIIRQFDPQKASFKTYIRTVVKLSYSTFTRNRYGYEARQRVFETEEATRLLSFESQIEATVEDTALVYEREVSYFVNNNLYKAKNLSKKKKEIYARKIFLLACKMGSFLDDRSILQISNLSGISRQYIKNKLIEVRGECGKKNEQFQKTIEKQNGYYIRTRQCLYEMKYLDKDTARFISLEKEYRYCLRRWESIKTRTSKQLRYPSNRYLAQTLGLSRGTIDTALASVQKARYSVL